MLRALIFDFDGLILDTETPLIDAYGEVHRRHGVAFDRDALVRSVGHADYAFDPWHGFSPHADREELEHECREHKAGLIARQPILPGVVALLDAAREDGLKAGVASNSEHWWVDSHLQRLGLWEKFAFVACREDAPAPKPAPDLYQLALNRLGDLRGPEAVAFEDSHTGSLAAKRAGLFTVAAPNPSTAHHDFSHADLRVASLAEIDLAGLTARLGGGAR